MNFSPNGSGSYSYIVPSRLNAFWRYNNAQHLEKSDYTQASWITLLKAEIDIDRPLYYSGFSSDGGHAFVCDGYQGTDFHFNFGWSGYGNGYYSLGNVGGFYIAISALSFAGLAMMVGLIAGAYLGLRYLYWEMEHIPSKPPKPSKEGAGGKSLVGIEPYIGAIVFLAAIVATWFYARNAYARVGGLLLCGIVFGVIIQRTRFCFVRCFRDPFMTGEGDMVRAVTYSIAISILGFAALKWTGLRPEAVYVTKTFWFGSLVGGIIFGFGMLLTGGCGSGSVWRAAEGHIKLMVAVLFFALSNSLFKALIKSSEGFQALIGHKFFIPDYISYKWTVIILLAVFVVYSLVATWNEETDKFTVEM